MSNINVQLDSNASMLEIIEALWRLPRDLVSDGYDIALGALGTLLPMTIHEYPSGMECGTWIVPEKWTCHEAYLETIDGRTLFTYEENPLHVMSYSLPFEGEISKDELLSHLHVNHRLSEAIPYRYAFYERDWGLCCTKSMRDGLVDERYKVVIRTVFDQGTMKIGEITAEGQTDETIIIAAHLDHPAMVNDDLSGVSVGIEVMRELLSMDNLRYTYKFLILPETIGSVAYLHSNEHSLDRIKGGLFLEMLGLDNPPALQESFVSNSELDSCFKLAMNGFDLASWSGPFRSIVVNDERQFNGPGFRIPMLSLSRALPRTNPDWPYLEYHSSFDCPDIVSGDALAQSKSLILRMVETLETNHVPMNEFKGEVFLSRYKMHIDLHDDPQGHRDMFGVMYLIDGEHSVAQIAEECGVSFDKVLEIVSELEQHGLVSYK